MEPDDKHIEGSLREGEVIFPRSNLEDVEDAKFILQQLFRGNVKDLNGKVREKFDEKRHIRALAYRYNADLNALRFVGCITHRSTMERWIQDPDVISRVLQREIGSVRERIERGGLEVINGGQDG